MATLTRSLGALGSGRPAPIRLTLDIFQQLGHWVNTTGNLCAINMCFAAAHARPPEVTRDIRTEIFFRPRHSGNSLAFDSPEMDRNPFQTIQFSGSEKRWQNGGVTDERPSWTSFSTSFVRRWPNSLLTYKPP